MATIATAAMRGQERQERAPAAAPGRALRATSRSSRRARAACTGSGVTACCTRVGLGADGRALERLRGGGLVDRLGHV